MDKVHNQKLTFKVVINPIKYGNTELHKNQKYHLH